MTSFSWSSKYGTYIFVIFLSLQLCLLALAADSTTTTSSGRFYCYSGGFADLFNLVNIYLFSFWQFLCIVSGSNLYQSQIQECSGSDTSYNGSWYCTKIEVNGDDRKMLPLIPKNKHVCELRLFFCS